MGFVFRYEALLKYREHLREKAEISLAAAQRELRQNRELMEEIGNTVTELNEKIGSELRNSVSSDQLRNYTSYITVLKVKMEYQALEIAKSEKKVAENMNILLEKTRQCNVFEKLKERDREKWQQDQNIMERNVMNEAALLRHGRDFL